MRNKRIFRLLIPIIAFALIGMPVESEAQDDVHMVDVEHLRPNEVSQVMITMFDIREYTFDFRNSKTLVFRAPDGIAEGIIRVIERLDVDPVPEPAATSVDLTAHILIATRASGQGADLPESLGDVVDQLRTVLPYGTYNLMDTLLTRVIDGERFTVAGVLPNLPGEPGYEPEYEIYATMRLSGNDNGQRTLRLDDLMFAASVPVSSDIRHVRFSTSVDIREDQQVVVGKASVADAALILVMTANIVE